MMGFSGREVLLSCLYAIAFGVGYYLILEAFRMLSRFCKALPRMIRLEVKSVKNYMNRKTEGSFFTFFSVFLFFLGFLLLSYFALDGQLRIYMLILSTAVYFLLDFTFSAILEDAFSRLLAVALFIIILPVRKIAKFIYKYINIILDKTKLK